MENSYPQYISYIFSALLPISKPNKIARYLLGIKLLQSKPLNQFLTPWSLSTDDDPINILKVNLVNSDTKLLLYAHIRRFYMEFAFSPECVKGLNVQTGTLSRVMLLRAGIGQIINVCVSLNLHFGNNY